MAPVMEELVDICQSRGAPDGRGVNGAVGKRYEIQAKGCAQHPGKPLRYPILASQTLNQCCHNGLLSQVKDRLVDLLPIR